jgi:hypothetical protein
LDLQRPAELFRDRAGQRDVETAVRLAAMMRRKRRQILVETDLEHLAGGGGRYGEGCDQRSRGSE